MKNLISMVDFVLEQHEQCISSTQRTYNYAKFLKQPLGLGMFIPCDENDNILEFPNILDHKYSGTDVNNFEPDLKEFQQAKEKVIFKNFKVNYFDLGGSPIDKNSSFEIMSNDNIQICIYKSKPDYFIWNFRTIEDLVKYNLELTKLQPE